MKTTRCACNGTLFFGDVSCTNCGRQVVRCAVCEETQSVEPAVDRTLLCQNPTCGAKLRLCQNAELYAVCNGTIERGAGNPMRCRYCRLNAIVPNLQIKGNVQKWQALEFAKHRVLAGLELAGFSLDAAAASSAHPLRFEFKQDGPRKRVTTGHWNGTITIRIDEADDVVRERNRVKFNEAKRTLVDHHRHELGHYVWDWLVQPDPAEFRRLFGDERNPTYAAAKKTYYSTTTGPDWRKAHVTKYATMHPWEDFAETFRVYLEMHAAVRTATHFGLIPDTDGTFGGDFRAFLGLGVPITELSRDFGLKDIVSASMPEPVRQKMEFIAGLPSRIPGGNPPLPAAVGQSPRQSQSQMA